MVFRETFKVKEGSKVSKTCSSSKDVLREFQGSFKDVLRKFQGCLRKVSSVFQENFTKSCMDLIAATRAEEGLFHIAKTHD